MNQCNQSSMRKCIMTVWPITTTIHPKPYYFESQIHFLPFSGMQSLINKPLTHTIQKIKRKQNRTFGCGIYTTIKLFSTFLILSFFPFLAEPWDNFRTKVHCIQYQELHSKICYIISKPVNHTKLKHSSSLNRTQIQSCLWQPKKKKMHIVTEPLLLNRISKSAQLNLSPTTLSYMSKTQHENKNYKQLKTQPDPWNWTKEMTFPETIKNLKLQNKKNQAHKMRM